MKEINFRKECHGNVNQIIQRLTNALKEEGLGGLTRVEKFDEYIPPEVITSNQELSYRAYQINPDEPTLLPCNAVVREISPNIISVELASPSLMMELIQDEHLTIMARETDSKLHRVLKSL